MWTAQWNHGKLDWIIRLYSVNRTLLITIRFSSHHAYINVNTIASKSFIWIDNRITCQRLMIINCLRLESDFVQLQLLVSMKTMCWEWISTAIKICYGSETRGIHSQYKRSVLIKFFFFWQLSSEISLRGTHHNEIMINVLQSWLIDELINRLTDWIYIVKVSWSASKTILYQTWIVRREKKTSSLPCYNILKECDLLALKTYKGLIGEVREFQRASQMVSFLEMVSS